VGIIWALVPDTRPSRRNEFCVATNAATSSVARFIETGCASIGISLEDVREHDWQLSAATELEPHGDAGVVPMPGLNAAGRRRTRGPQQNRGAGPRTPSTVVEDEE
jgi:hypothetical protein